ncbi:unnamed protein product, partial [Hermetia illucens]
SKLISWHKNIRISTITWFD